jgi:hypothetical protein
MNSPFCCSIILLLCRVYEQPLLLHHDLFLLCRVYEQPLLLQPEPSVLVLEAHIHANPKPKVKFTSNKKQMHGLKIIHRKKRFTSFPSPAGMSLTTLPLGRNISVMTSLFPPRESLVVTSRLGTGNSRSFFYDVSIIVTIYGMNIFYFASKIVVPKYILLGNPWTK